MTKYYPIKEPGMPKIIARSLTTVLETDLLNIIMDRIKGIARPNLVAKTLSLDLLKKLSDNYQLVPSRIVASIEEGVCITYNQVTTLDDRSMIIEVYNDTSIALIITDNTTKKIIYREDVQRMDLSSAVEIFKNLRKENS